MEFVLDSAFGCGSDWDPLGAEYASEPAEVFDVMKRPPHVTPCVSPTPEPAEPLAIDFNLVGGHTRLARKTSGKHDVANCGNASCGGLDDGPPTPELFTSYEDAVSPRGKGKALEESEEEAASLIRFLRLRDLKHLEKPLLSIGARTIADLSYLTPAYLASVGVTKEDILNLSVTVVR